MQTEKKTTEKITEKKTHSTIIQTTLFVLTIVTVL